jgi:hypothetical protein
MRNVFTVKNDKVEGMSRPKVARTHFHEDVLILNSQQSEGSNFIKTISLELALAIGLTAIDKISGSSEYFNVPNQSLKQNNIFTSLALNMACNLSKYLSIRSPTVTDGT